MPEYLDPIIFSIRTMDRATLDQISGKHRHMLRTVRIRYWRVWLRNRLFGIGLVFLWLIVFTGAAPLLPFNPKDYPTLTIIVASLWAWLITWFFMTHGRMNAFSNGLESHETELKSELDTCQHTWRVIKSRYRELGE